MTITGSRSALELIKLALENQGMTIRDLAGELGYVRPNGAPTSYAYNILAGHQPISRNQLGKIAEILHMDADNLYFAAGFIPPDIEAALIRDRAFVEQVRALMR